MWIDSAVSGFLISCTSPLAASPSPVIFSIRRIRSSTSSEWVRSRSSRMHPPSRPSGVPDRLRIGPQPERQPVALDRQFAVPDRLVPARRLVDESGQLPTRGRQVRHPPADDPVHCARVRAQQPRRRRVDLPDHPLAVHHDDPLGHVLQHLMGQTLDSGQLVVDVQVAPPLPDEEDGAQDEHRRDDQPQDHAQEQLTLEDRDLRIGRWGGVGQPRMDERIVVECLPRGHRVDRQRQQEQRQQHADR